jgi:hypothetical protein
MRNRFLQVLESDEKDVNDDALGRFWPRAKKLTACPEKGVLVDLTTWAARRRTPSTTR